jgi:hypothetical protein
MKVDFDKFNGSVSVNQGRGARIILLILFFLFFSFCANSQKIRPEYLTDNTAFLIPDGKWESGIFQSFRFGLNEKIELRSNALLMPVLPNAGIKFSIRSGKGLLLSSEHSISFPTVFLNVMSFKGTGGLISPEFSFPFILTLSNSLIASTWIGSTSLLTADAGFTLAFRRNKPDYQSSIDIPFIYQRMAHYYEGASLKAGISFKGKIVKTLNYEEGARIILITRKSDNIFLENSGSLVWSSKGFLRIKGGYLLSWGKYPFGNHLQLWPAFDLIFGSRHKTENQ